MNNEVVCHRPYCCNENSTQKSFEQNENLQLYSFDRYGFCIECGVNESGIEPVYTITENRIKDEILSLLDKIRYNNFSSTSKEFNYFQGTFQRLLKPNTFFEEMFPGSPTTVQNSLPKSLHELLSWQPFFLRVKDFIPKITKSAAEVLENVRVKGLTRGDIMDAEVEKTLSPQIFQESLAREIVIIFRNICKKASFHTAKNTLRPAILKLDEKVLDKLVVEDLDQFLTKKKLYYHQDQFLGPEWTDLLRRDLNRFSNNENFTEADSLLFSITTPFSSSETCSVNKKNTPKIAFIQTEILSKYPALTEVIKCIHDLAFELNSNKNVTFNLLEASSVSTMIVHYRTGDVQDKRVDNRLGDNDSGFRYTVSYNISNQVGNISSGDESLSNLTFNSLESISNEDICIKNDRLFIYRSFDVYNKRSASRSDYYSILFFIHGS